MESVGKKLKTFCLTVSSELLKGKCDYDKRLIEGQLISAQVKELLAKTKVVTIIDLPLLRNYEPNLDSLIDGLQRVKRHKETNSTSS